MKQKRTYLVGRDSKTGKFVPASKVYRNPQKYKVETVTKTTTVPKELRFVVTPPKNRKRR
jgi:hypothetical protein